MFIRRGSHSVEIEEESLYSLASASSVRLAEQMPYRSRLPVIHVVDDDADARSAVVRALRSFKILAESYSSPGELLERLPIAGPGCLILDLVMPEMNGLELQKQVAERCPDLPVIFVTGQGQIPETVRAMQAGALDFLTKPFDSMELFNAVQKAIDRSNRMLTAKSAIEKDWAVFSSLTPREKDVCLLVARGYLNKQVAGMLGTAVSTVKLQRSCVMKKLGAGSAADLVRLIERLRDAGKLDQAQGAAG